MESLGALFMSGISGLVLTEEEKKFIASEKIGGIILFSNNYENPQQLGKLVNSIQSLRDHYPLLIAVDHEGGRVIRFKKDFTQFTAMLNVGNSNSPKLCFEVHEIMAKELKACGVNVNLSPVCDIFSNPENKVIGDRAFGKNKEIVSKFVSSAIRGLQTSHIIGCAKHFPGHGDTFKDSHEELPIIKKELNKIIENEIFTFRKAVKSRVEMIMIGHLQIDSIDSEYPSSLSKKTYELLRKELKFKRIAITDDMDMKAITDNYSHKEAATMALNAGADILIYRSMKSCKSALIGVKESYRKKEILRDLVKEKILRINEVKKRYLSDYSTIILSEIAQIVGKRSHLDFLEKFQLNINK